MGVHDECDRPYGGVQWGNPDDVKFFVDGVHGSGKRECLQVRSDSDAHIHGVHYTSDGLFWGEVGYWRQSEIDCTSATPVPTPSPTPVPTPSPTPVPTPSPTRDPNLPKPGLYTVWYQGTERPNEALFVGCDLSYARTWENNGFSTA